MANNLKILITGELNTGATIGQINTAIKGIEKKINKLKLNVQVNDNVLKTMNNFSKQMEKISLISLKSNKVIQEENKKTNRSVQEEIKTVDELTERYKRLVSEVNKYKRDGSLKSTTSTYQDDKGNGRVINTNAKGDVTSYKDIENIQKFEKEQRKLQKTLQELGKTGRFTTEELRKIGQGINTANTIRQLDNLKNRMSNMKLDQSLISDQDRLRQSLKRVYDQGLMNEQRFKRFNTLVDSTKNVTEIDKVRNALKRVENSGKNKNTQQSLLSQAQALLGTNSKKLDVTGVNRLVESVKNIRPNALSASNELKRLEQQLKQYASQARVARTESLTFGSALKQALQGFSLWAMTAQLVYAPVRALQDMTQRLIEIDTLMTDIRRVMDMPDFRFTELLEEAVNTSDELSSRLTDVLKIMGDFGRMGFDDGQLIDITKTAQVLQNISDLDAESSVNTLTSAMLNFNIAAEDSIQIADKLNEVDNNFAISTKDLSDGIRKAAATAKTFGVDIDDLTGYIAAIGSTTRESGSIIGNGLKTIFSRLTTIEGGETALNSVNVAMRDVAGNVRPVSDIIEDLAGKWSSLSDEQRQNTAVTLAGRHHVTRFLALLNNFEIAQSATATAIDSSGSAMKEQEKYADSLEARINRLDTAWNKFTLSMGEAFITDGLISGIETLNDMATTIAKLVDKYGFLTGFLGTVGVAAVLLSTKFNTLTTSLMFGTQGMTRMQLASVGLTSGLTRLQVASLTAGRALKTLAASTVVGLVFVGIGFALEKLIGKYSEAKQSQEDFEQSQQKGIDALTNNRKETESLIDQYNNMTEARKEMSDSWDVEQEEKYLALQQQIGDMYPQLISYIDAAGNKHIKSKNQIEEEIKATEKLIAAKKEEMKLKALDDISKAIDNRDDINKDIDRKEKEIKDTQRYDGKTFELAVAKGKSDLASLQQQWSQASQKITSEVLKVSDAYVNLEIDPNIRHGVDEFIQSLDLSKLKPEELEEYAKQIGKTVTSLQTAYEKGDLAGFDKAKKSLADYAEKMGATDLQAKAFALSFDDVKKSAELGASAIFAGKDGMDGLDESMGDLADSTMDVVNAQEELSTVAEKLVGVSEKQISQIQEHINAYQLLSTVENQNEEQKSMLAEATEYLAGMYPHLAKGSNLNVEAMQKEAEQTDILLKAIDEMKKGHLSAEEQMTLSTALNAKSRINLLLQQAKAYEAFARKLAQEANALTSAADFGRYEDAEIAARKFMGKANEGYAGFSKELEALLPDMDKWISQLAQATDYQGKYYESTSKDSIFVSDKFKQALELLNLEIEKQNKLQAKYPSHSKEYQDSIKKEIGLMKQKKTLIEAQTKALDLQIRSGKIVQTGMVKSPSVSSYSGGSSSSYASGGDNGSQIWNFFKSKGFSDSIVAGIMGNLKLESGLNPSAVNKSSGASGIAQWLGGRKTGLMNYASSMGKSWQDLQTQLEWLWKELNSTERRSMSWLQSNQGASASTVAYEFDRLFERSEGTHRPQRANYANQYLSQYAGSGGGASYSTSYSTSSAGSSAADSAQLVDQAKSDLLQLQQDALNIEEQIRELNMLLVKSTIDAYENKMNSLENEIKIRELEAEDMGDKSSLAYQDKLHVQVKLQEQKKKVLNEQLNYIRSQISANNELTAAQKDELRGVLSDKLVMYKELEYAILNIHRAVQQSRMDELLENIEKRTQEAERRLRDIDNQLHTTDEDDQPSRNKLNKKRLDELKAQRQGIINIYNAVEKLRPKLWGNADAMAQNTEEMQKWRDALAQIDIDIFDQTELIKDEVEGLADTYIEAYKEYYEKRRKIDQKELDDEYSAYEKMIKKKLDLIDDTENESDFQKELAKRQEEIAKIQKQINLLSMDETQKGKVADLQQELADKQEELSEYLHDREVDQRKDSLNEELEAKKEEIDEKKRLMDEYYDNLLNDERNFAKIREEIMQGNIDSLADMLDIFTKDIEDNMGSIGKSIAENLIDQIAKAKEGLESAQDAISKMKMVYSGTDTDVSGSDTAKIDHVTIKEDTPFLEKKSDGTYEATGRVLAKGSVWKAYGVDSKNGVYNVGAGFVTSDPKFTKYQKFNTGGFTGNSEGLAWLDKKELIFKEKDSTNMLKALDITRSIAHLIPKLQIPKLLNPNHSQPNVINMNINIDKLTGGTEGANDFFKVINNRLRGGGFTF